MKRAKVVFGRFGEPRQESTNDVFRATWKGAVLAESERTILIEDNRYFPPEDVNFDHLDHSSRQTVCPWKGTASYYDIVVDGEHNNDAAWYHQHPSAAASEIEDHVAFRYGVDVSRKARI
jgi:uncharacterized protein (DUF427 family)